MSYCSDVLKCIKISNREHPFNCKNVCLEVIDVNNNDLCLFKSIYMIFKVFRITGYSPVLEPNSLIPNKKVGSSEEDEVSGFFVLSHLWMMGYFISYDYFYLP